MQEDCMLLKEALFSKFLRLLPENLFYTYLYLSKYKTKGVIFIKGSFIHISYYMRECTSRYFLIYITDLRVLGYQLLGKGSKKGENSTS